MNTLSKVALAIFLTAVGFSTQKAEAACERESCPLYLKVSLADQIMYVYREGQPVMAYQVSTGGANFETIEFEGNLNGRVEERYMSKAYPGGNYIDPETGEGLGNMPYAMFFKGGYALHGTVPGNFSKLGSPASHGCVRMYPQQAKELNRIVRKIGARNVWVSVVDDSVGFR